MRTKLFALCALFLASSFSANAETFEKKDKKEEITYLVSMSCKKCQKRIEENIAFEKGVTDLDIDLSKKLVTIEYRTDKTNPEKLKAAFKKLGFTATPFKGAKKAKKASCCEEKD